MPPTFSEDIKPLFSQYDRTKMLFFCDLWDFEQVKAHAREIYLALQEDPTQPDTGWSLLPNVHVMPLYTGPFSQAQVDLFKGWIEGGCQSGRRPSLPPQPSPLLPGFVALSECLTGFDDLTNDLLLAQIYFDLILTSCGEPSVEALLKVWQEIAADKPTALEAAVAAHIVTDVTFGPIAQKIIVLWYNAIILGDSLPPQQIQDQYTKGLVWKVILAHPMGYAVENTPFYWQYCPQNGLYTGAYRVASASATRPITKGVNEK